MTPYTVVATDPEGSDSIELKDVKALYRWIMPLVLDGEFASAEELANFITGKSSYQEDEVIYKVEEG